MASDLHVIVVPPHPAGSRAAAAAVRDVVDELERLERCWSRFLPTSDISRIHRLGAAGGGALTVDPSTLVLLASMLEGVHVTAGRFDPTVLRAVVAEGYDTSRVRPDDRCDLDPDAGLAATIEALELDPSTDTVVVPPGLALDPGGIGKGLAADLAVLRLLERGVAGALVGIGGDLAMAGTAPDPAGWLVDVEHVDPRDGVLCSIAVSGGGVATSSTRSRRWWRDGGERHHQIDPRTSQCSTTDLDAVTVIAPSGWLAEVHATAALAVGSARVRSYLDDHGLSGLAVRCGATRDEVIATADLRDVVLRTRSDAR